MLLPNSKHSLTLPYLLSRHSEFRYLCLRLCSNTWYMSSRIGKFGYLCLRFATLPNVPEARIVNFSTKLLYFAVTPHLFCWKHNRTFHDDIIPSTSYADITNQETIFRLHPLCSQQQAASFNRKCLVRLSDISLTKHRKHNVHVLCTFQSTQGSYAFKKNAGNSTFEVQKLSLHTLKEPSGRLIHLQDTVTWNITYALTQNR